MTDFTDDLFHCCALAAFVEQARACGGWPNSHATRRRAYQLYEITLAAESHCKTHAATKDGSE